MSEIIRSLGFYQPFGSLMLHGKIETRWVREGKKPPFPLGKYVLYTTLKECTNSTLYEWCGSKIMSSIYSKVEGDATYPLKGFAIAIGELYHIQPMAIYEEDDCFVLWKGEREVIDKKRITHKYRQQTLLFRNIERINPFKFKGKQGVGILTDEEKSKIQII